MTPQQFRSLIDKHYSQKGRHDLPWRVSPSPYKVLVSEMMLQQTQVERVIPYFTAWMETFPSLEILAEASLARVLRQWQGLGYNRRAKSLHEAARIIVNDYSGHVPEEWDKLVALPGIGPYTASAIQAFAFNQDAVVIETNIRTAIMHTFFTHDEKVSDQQIRDVLERVLPHGRAREWYSALMDYGAHLKRLGLRLNDKTQGYTRQSSFKGSDREARGMLLRALSGGSCGEEKLFKLFPSKRRPQVGAQLEALLREGFIKRRGRTYGLSD